MEFYLPKGFKFSGVHCGVKPNTTKLDVALIVSDFPATAAGVYTRNLVCGAPVQLDRARTPGKGFRAIVVNSGVANACTGDEGFENAQKMAEIAAGTVGADGDAALVMSTGVIGIQLPMDRIEKGIDAAGKELASTKQGFLNAAHAIMTTDTVEKIASRKIILNGGNEVVLAGMCKGAAMIGPNMATMLCAVLTDAALLPEQAQDFLRRAADKTFNCVSVEGHTSTSDTVLLLANGMGNPTPLTESDAAAFDDALTGICADLARMIPNDGEGVTHLITINVLGCATATDAKAIAKTIANDVLVKTAICGADPNWGRIVSAAGRAGVDFNPAYVSLKVNGYDLYRDGTPLPFDKTTVSDSIRNNRETVFEIHFEEGDASARFWTSDLTTEYVHLNADYTT